MEESSYEEYKKQVAHEQKKKDYATRAKYAIAGASMLLLLGLYLVISNGGIEGISEYGIPSLVCGTYGIFKGVILMIKSRL